MAKKNYNRMMYYNMLLFALATNISPAITSISIVIGSFIVLIYRVNEHEWPSFDKTLMKWFAGYFLLWMLISLTSIEIANSVNEVFATFYRIFPLFFIMVTLKDRKQLGGIILAFSVSVLITDMVAIWQWISLETGFARASGLSNTANFLGSHMLMAIPVLLWWLKVGDFSKEVKYFLKIDIVLSLVALFASGTRGAWLAFCVIFMIYVFTRKCIMWKKVFMLGIAILTIVSFVAVIPSFKGRIASIGDFQESGHSERVLMWKSAIDILVDYPITGIGSGEFGLVYNTTYISPLAIARAPADNPRLGYGHPHNNFLKRLAEGGILGGVAFFLLNIYLFGRLVKEYRKSGYAQYSFALMGILIFIGIHIEGMTDTNIIDVPIMREFWFLFGLALVSDKIAAKNA
ncbi:O-antigen ligase family protein [Selenomonas ruminantium]|uniref:O-antigen ligase n=1 Tax=Selenomonas ruminantium TaxID=971 RepID=A0A1H3WN16_SELRU|nr:O-antigen ligase family protein [Selenomonas ruminantium]SDZ88340.1 O-antigen ligase [Selenomonas ruminantium]